MRLRAQWTLLESMRTGLFTQMVIVPLFRDHGILTQVAGDHQNVLKILPPLITTEEQADEFVDAIDDVLGDLERSLGLLWGVGSSLALPALRARRLSPPSCGRIPISRSPTGSCSASSPRHRRTAGRSCARCAPTDRSAGCGRCPDRSSIARSRRSPSGAHRGVRRGRRAPAVRNARSLRVTRRGRAALRRWLDTPVEHVRDVRTEFLVKLALLERSERPSRPLVERQIEHLAPVVRRGVDPGRRRRLRPRARPLAPGTGAGRRPVPALASRRRPSVV